MQTIPFISDGIRNARGRFARIVRWSRLLTAYDAISHWPVARVDSERETCVCAVSSMNS